MSFQSDSERFGPNAMDSEYSEVPSQETGNVSPQRGTGRKRGRPKGSGSGRGRASKGASPSLSPKPVNKTTKTFSFSVFMFSVRAELQSLPLLNAFIINTLEIAYINH